MAQQNNTQMYQNLLNLKKENYKLREELKVQIDLKYKLFDENIKLKQSLQESEEESEEEDENNKLRYENIELKSKLMDENKLKKELDEIKRERDKLKRDIEIQKLGGLKLCYN